MRNLFLLGILGLAFFTSCNKDEEPKPEEPKTNSESYSPLSIGNYWVYKHFDIDTSGNVTNKNITDSVIVTRDTLINGHKYYVLEGDEYLLQQPERKITDMLRDSLGYIINSKGQIRFSKDNFSDILYTYSATNGNNDAIFSVKYQMEKPVKSVTVPAGDFNVLNFQGTVTDHRRGREVEDSRYINRYFAKGVGQVLDTYFDLDDQIVSERRLVRYHVGN